jgi:hypothetical protein
MLIIIITTTTITTGFVRIYHVSAILVGHNYKD